MSVARPRRRPAGAAVSHAVRAAVLLALAAAACAEDRPADVLPDRTYVAVMARLGVVLDAERSEADGAFDADSARASILAAYRVAAEDLARYAARFGGDPDHMHDVWAAIADSARALRERWTTEEGGLELPDDVRGPGGSGEAP